MLALFGFVLFGPGGLINSRTVWLALVFPLAWSIFTLFRGEVVDWYPYPFIDVTEHGYGRVLLNMSGIAAAFLLVGFAYRWADDRLTKRRQAT